jgi:beta-phosphoglucomutase
MRPRALLLDMDGVVVDSMAFHAAAWKEVLGEHGLVLDDMDIFRREGMSGRQSVEDIFSEHGVPFPGDAAYLLLEEKKHSLFERNHVNLYPLVTDILAWARNERILTALVTGSPRRSVEYVVPAGVISLFNAVITAGDVSRGKPDPEPYLKAMSALGVDAGEALVVENSPMGIRSASGAGAFCVALETTLPARFLAGADRVFRDHAALFGYMRAGME